MRLNDDPVLLIAIGRGHAIDESGQPPTLEERIRAGRLLIDWHDRQNDLWKRNPQAAAKIERELFFKWE